jgi:hypothetical protein
MSNLVFSIGLLICLFPFFLRAQEFISPETLLENLESEELGETDFLQILKDLEDHPIEINSATTKELLRIPFLNSSSAKSIINHRNQNGEFKQRDDLLRIPGISDELVDAILPYILFEKRGKDSFFDYRIQAGEDLHTIRGYEDDRYENPLYFYQRIRWQPHSNLQTTVLWEKDAGEADWFDFGSLSLRYNWVKAKSDIQLGDYDLEAGQRLVFSNSYGQLLSIGNEIPFTQTQINWRGKFSANENSFMRGVLWDYSIAENTSLLFAFSNRDIDATLTNDSSAVRSIYISGYHRTENEVRKKNQFTERIYSGVVKHDFATAQFGILAAHADYSLPLKVQDSNFGQKLNYVSGFYSQQSGLINLRGEAAFLNWQYPAIQQSIFLKYEKFVYGILFYYYHPDYWSFHGRGFGEISDSPNNQQGFFLSFSSRLFPKTEFAGYLNYNEPIRDTDEFRFLKRSFQLQISQSFNKNNFSLRFTERVRDGNTGINIIPELKTRAIRFHVTEEPSSRLRLNQRIEFSWVNSEEFLEGDKNYGFTIYLDARYRISNGLSIQTRWTQFDVSDYDLRLYEFETDLPGNFRNILLNGRGYKWFALVKYKLGSRWRFSVKYREIYYPDEKTLGSGLDTVYGNRKEQLRAQIQILY